MSTINPDVINATAFTPATDVKYAKPKINKSGGKGISILNNKTSKVLMLETPLMLTWGISEFVDEKTGKRSYDLALQFPQEEYRSEATDKFLQAMEEFQDKIKADAITNSKEWMNKPKLTPEVVDALFNPILKYSKDPNTGEPNLTKKPTFKIKVDFWDNQFTCEIFGTDGRIQFPLEGSGSTPMDLVPKASNVALVIQCGGLWFANGKFGVTWKLVQAVVQPKASYKGICMIKCGAPAAEGASALGAATSASSAPPKGRGVQMVDDSDDDDAMEGAGAVAGAAPAVTATEEEGEEEEYAADVHSTPAPTPTPAQEASAGGEPPAKVVKKIVRKVAAKV